MTSLLSVASPTTWTFDGAPTAPTAVEELATWDVQVHSRDSNTWYTMDSIQAQHGPDCSGPPATHPNNSYAGAVFQCANHIMTAINASGYGLIYLTPPQMLDFSTEGVVSFNISSERMSRRDWWDIWVTPYGDNLAAPFDQGDVDLDGAPQNTIHIDIDNAQGAPILTVYRNGNGTTYNTGSNTPPTLSGITPGTNQSAVRQSMKLTVTPTHVRFERLASSTATAVVFFDQAITGLPWTQGVVQFGHHSYTPTKDNSGIPATWHWDSFSVAPAIPFTILKGDRRYIDNANQTLTFATPAPAGAMLRFTAIGSVSASYNGGPFALLTRQDGTASPRHPEHMSSYFVPIPAGTTTVRLRFYADDWYTTGFPMIAKDFSVWSQTEVPITPSPPTTSPTPLQDTPTPGPTSTPIPTSTSTATPIPQPTATPTPPATPTPVACQVRLRNRLNTGWTFTGGYIGTIINGECKR